MWKEMNKPENDDVYFLESQTIYPVEADDIPVAVNCSSVRNIYKIKWETEKACRLIKWDMREAVLIESGVCLSWWSSCSLEDRILWHHSWCKSSREIRAESAPVSRKSLQIRKSLQVFEKRLDGSGERLCRWSSETRRKPKSRRSFSLDRVWAARLNYGSRLVLSSVLRLTLAVRYTNATTTQSSIQQRPWT